MALDEMDNQERRLPKLGCSREYVLLRLEFRRGA